MTKNANQTLEQAAESFLSSLPPNHPRTKDIRTRTLNLLEALRPKPPEDEPLRHLDMRLPTPTQLRPTASTLPAKTRPVDTTGRLPRLPANRKLARERAGFTLREVALAAGTTDTTAKIYEEHRARIRRNDKRQALDEIYSMFIEEPGK